MQLEDKGVPANPTLFLSHFLWHVHIQVLKKHEENLLEKIILCVCVCVCVCVCFLKQTEAPIPPAGKSNNFNLAHGW